MPSNLAQFSDVAAVLDAALANGGGRYELPTPGKAIKWRQRAYTLRKTLSKLDAQKKLKLLGASPSTPYDQMYLRIEPHDRCVVLIEILKPEGRLTTLEGAPLEAGPTPAETLVTQTLVDEDDIAQLIADKGL